MEFGLLVAGVVAVFRLPLVLPLPPGAAPASMLRLPSISMTPAASSSVARLCVRARFVILSTSSPVRDCWQGRFHSGSTRAQ